MTEHTVPMGGTALAEPPAPVLPLGDDDTADAGNRRKLMIVGAILGAVVLLLAAFFMLKGGGSAPVASGAPVLPHPAAAAPSTHQQGHAVKPLKLPQAYKGHVGKDPFKPLYVAPPAAAPSSGPTGSQPSGTTDGSGDPGGVGSPVTQPTTSHPTTTVSLGHPVWVELVRVDGTHSATFVVGYSNGKRLTTRTFRNVLAPKGSTGTIFAKQFTLLSLQNGEATIQFGDGTPLDIAPGAANKVVVN
jgi:hypothetical protein